MYSLFSTIDALLSSPLLEMFKLRDNYAQVTVQANKVEITCEEMLKLFPKKFHFE